MKGAGREGRCWNAGELKGMGAGGYGLGRGRGRE